MLKVRPESGAKADAAKPSDQARVTFRAPPDFHEGACVWVSLVPGPEGGALITLNRAYADLKPAIGWRIDHDGILFEVSKVAGLVLTCMPV